MDSISGGLLACTLEWPDLPVLSALRQVFITGGPSLVFLSKKNLEYREDPGPIIFMIVYNSSGKKEITPKQSLRNVWQALFGESISWHLLFVTQYLVHRAIKNICTWSQGRRGMELKRIWALDSEMASHLLPSDSKQDIFLHCQKITYVWGCNNIYILGLWYQEKNALFFQYSFLYIEGTHCLAARTQNI